MAAAGKFAVVLGDRIPIAGGDLGRVGIADCAALISIELATQLQLQRVHAADELLAHLLHQRGITGETARVQAAHLVDQGLQLLARLGTILHCGTNLVEKVQTLVNLALGIGRIGTLLRGNGPPGDAGIAGVNPTIRVPIAIGRAPGRIAHLTSDAVADLAGLTGLPATREWAGLELLAAGLTLAGLSVGMSTEAGKLVAQAG